MLCEFLGETDVSLNTYIYTLLNSEKSAKHIKLLSKLNNLLERGM